jgi:hypothetical protein
MISMPNLNLGDQVAQVIVALEKATPQVLELAERSFRSEALLHGVLYAVLFIASLSGALWLWAFIRHEKVKKYEQRNDDLIVASIVGIFICLILAVVMLCQLPGEAHQYLNARYYAVCDLLVRVKP